MIIDTYPGVPVTLIFESVDQIGRPFEASTATMYWYLASVRITPVVSQISPTEFQVVLPANSFVTPQTVSFTATKDPGNQSLPTIQPVQIRINSNPISLSGPATARVGTPYQITATATNLTPNTLTWTSSDTTKATVSNSGLVTLLNTGLVTITAASTVYPQLQKTLPMNVQGPEISSGFRFVTTGTTTPPVIVSSGGVRNSISLEFDPIVTLPVTIIKYNSFRTMQVSGNPSWGYITVNLTESFTSTVSGVKTILASAPGYEGNTYRASNGYLDGRLFFVIQSGDGQTYTTPSVTY